MDLLLVDGLLFLAVLVGFVVLVLGLMGRSPNLGMNLACRSVCRVHRMPGPLTVEMLWNLFVGSGAMKVCDRRLR